MNRKEYELIYDSLKYYHVLMDREQRQLSEQILENLFPKLKWKKNKLPKHLEGTMANLKFVSNIAVWMMKRLKKCLKRLTS